MRRGIASILAVVFVSSLALVAGLHAQAKKDQKTKLDQLEGYVLSVDKEKSEITIRQRKTTNMQWTVIYTPETKFTDLNKEATVDKVREGLRVICEGSFGAEKTKLHAVRIDIRTDK